MSMALWESTKNIKELTYPFLADFLRKKIEIDKKLDSVMPSLIKEENENQGGDMVGFQLGITLEVNELLKTISKWEIVQSNAYIYHLLVAFLFSFGAIRSSVVTGKKIATPESVRLRSQLSADVVVDRNGSPASVIFESEQTAPVRIRLWFNDSLIDWLSTWILPRKSRSWREWRKRHTKVRGQFLSTGNSWGNQIAEKRDSLRKALCVLNQVSCIMWKDWSPNDFFF